MKNLVPGLFRNRVKRLRKIRKDIVNMLAADRQTDGAGRDILLGKLLVVQLTMRGACLPPFTSMVKMDAPPFGK